MKIAITTSGRLHSFEQAAQLDRYGVLGRIFTGYPPFALRNERVPKEKICSVWALHTAVMASFRLPFQEWVEPYRAALFELARDRLDSYARRRLADCDVLIGLSGSGLKSGLEMQRRGGVYICDRGSTHILFQDRILREEAEIVGRPIRPVHDYAIARELAEYAASDAIFTPSTFTLKTFVDQGVPVDKLKLVPYGANTSIFAPGFEKADHFTVLFAGQTTYRKGLHYLLKAWSQWAPRSAELRIAGWRSQDYDALVRWAGGTPRGVTMLGQLDRATLAREMAAAHVLVMPSIEEGLPLVMCQAMACGTPVVATENAGAATLYTHGVEGLIGPARSTEFLHEAFDALAADPRLAATMAGAALLRSGEFADTTAYGNRVMEAVTEIYRAKGFTI